MTSSDESGKSPKRRRKSKNKRQRNPPSTSSSNEEIVSRKVHKMAQYLPITLSGENLGQRHRYLNMQVLQAANNQVSFQDFENLPEQTPVDRLFKIDLANKLKNVDYILKNIKDDDMLYVSRALKSKWLVERRDIINPKYLEDVLFPEMVMPAISKMKHWMYINLRDLAICQEFYQYYKDTNFDFAVKFLCHCNKEFVFNEFPKILTKITPHYLKVFGEKDPKLVKIYFDSMATNNELVKQYLKEEEKFYKNIKCMLKLDPHMFLDITEKYHNLDVSNKLSPSATDYILRFHKSRFMAKPELYVVYLLHIPTVAHCLSVEECQEVVIKLARAEYLSWWFSYANVEPLVKRVSYDKRAAFKKLVFVEKKVGDRVAEWPYVQPASPVDDDTTFDESHVFHDRDYEPILMVRNYRLHIRKRRCGAEDCSVMMCCLADCCPTKSELQKLFDEFRFVGFEGTLHELSVRVGAAKSADRRRDMLLVLVSKSGGRTEAVRALLQLAMRLRNEPVHQRAAVVRSLVKRACAWRLPQDVWDTMLEYAHGLGLDGSKSEAECREGLHAVVLRQILATGDCEPAVRTAFLDEFSTLAEYKLVTGERMAIAAGLQRILVTASADVDPKAAAGRLGQLFDVLEKYHIPLKLSQVVSTVAALAERNSDSARPLLVRLYEARVGRRELFRHCLKFRHDDAALLNALRHDPNAITPKWLVKLLAGGETRANNFFLKLAVYFSETDGIAEKIRQSLQEKIAAEPDVKLARPLATLAGSGMRSIWCEQDMVGDKHYKLAAALRANMHHARPAPDALVLGWRKAGMKSVAWRAMRCRPTQVTQLAQTLLEERVKRTVRLALILAQRTDCAVDLFSTAMTIRPIATLRAALLYFRKLGEAADVKIWDIVKPILTSVNLTPREGLRDILNNLDWVPKSMKPDYCAVLYLALDKISDHNANDVLVELMKILPQVSDDLLETVMLRTLANMDNKNTKSYPAIVNRYLMLSKSSDEQKTRFDKIAEPFLAKVYAFHDGKEELNRNFFSSNVDQIMTSLHYNSAFFDVTYQHCIPVIERVKSWMEKFLPKEKYFKQYVKIHTTMLYYKAVRQCIKQKPEIFEDPVKKMTEGVDIVGYTFGRYVVKELAELKSQYFDSIIELYHKTFAKYFNKYIGYVSRKESFVVAVIKGILLESVGCEARLAIHVLKDQYNMQSSVREEIIELMIKSEHKEMQFFVHAEMFA